MDAELRVEFTRLYLKLRRLLEVHTKLARRVDALETSKPPAPAVDGVAPAEPRTMKRLIVVSWRAIAFTANSYGDLERRLLPYRMLLAEARSNHFRRRAIEQSVLAALRKKPTVEEMEAKP